MNTCEVGMNTCVLVSEFLPYSHSTHKSYSGGAKYYIDTSGRLRQAEDVVAID